MANFNKKEDESFLEYKKTCKIINDVNLKKMLSSNAEEIISMDAPMAIRIDVTSTMVTADAMKKALSEGLEKSTGNNTGPISKEIIHKFK